MAVFYRYFRWLSLDVVMGAIFVLSFLGQYYQVQLPFSVYIALGSAVWLIYTADHLIDARKVETPSSPRHQFHKENFSRLIITAGFVLSIALINITFLPEVVIRNGALLSAACVGYLVLVFIMRKLWVKELIVAIAYAVGVFLAPASLSQDPFTITGPLLCSQLALVALINLMIFSYYEVDRDREDGFGSLIIMLGIKRSVLLIHGISLLGISGSLTLFFLYGSDLQLLFFLMTTALYCIFLFPAASLKDRYRILGDGVFYLPVLFMV